MKIDRFSAIVIAIVLLLLVAAVVTVNRSGGGQANVVEYVEDDSPAAPVQNAFMALQEGAVSKARSQYSAEIAQGDDSEYASKPWSSGQVYYDQEDTARRLRILSVEIDETDPDQALVTFVLDTYRSNSGPFGAGSSWSSQRTVEVVREEDEWKINSPEYFY